LQTLYNGTFARLLMTPQRISIQWGRLSGSNEALDTNLNPEASIASPARFPREKTRRNIVSGTTPKVMNGYRLRRHWNRRVKAPLSSRERSATAKAGPEGPRLVRRIALGIGDDPEGCGLGRLGEVADHPRTYAICSEFD
jgi:hypothetical protein